MKSLEELAAQKGTQWKMWAGPCFPSEPATAASVVYIESRLQIRLPQDFVEFSRLAPDYGVWFGSIGEDYDSHNHLLRLNEEFRRPDDWRAALSDRWVMLNHGHDGDCDCWDVSADGDPEHSIWYVDVETQAEPVLIATTFKDYLERS